MSHIADLLVNPSTVTGLSNYISRGLSPNGAHEAMTDSSPAEDKDKEKFIWRMHQPAETTRKYQLFPSKDKLSIQAGRKSPDPEKTLAVGQPSNAAPLQLLGSAMRLKAKEQTLVRRRKASVPELGPMTTVQEVAMDSPTIPGRPPLHERSISAPGYNSWKHNVFGDTMISRIVGPALDEKPEIASSNSQSENGVPISLRRRRSGSPVQPMSPRILAPLVIPASTGPQPHVVDRQQSTTFFHLNNDSPPNVPPKSARMLPAEKSSPQSQTPYTPLTGLTTNLSSVAATPVSAATTEGQVSPTSAATTMSARGPSPMGLGHTRDHSESNAFFGPFMGHRRERSDASIMDRGRPKKRFDGSPITHRRTASKQLQDQKAFELLPHGIKAMHAGDKFDESEIDILKKQAVGQAAKFEVLGFKDVEALSRELRALDERCEYLRKTHHSLRSGRRNLHERICTYLRSPRIAQFSHASLLKQEEALVELDLSIDDWVSKLELADNRRTRVRQKLLEHVAAALTLSSPSFPGPLDFPPRSSSREPTPPQLMTMAMQRSMGENTPPRSPTKTSQNVGYAASPSPSRSPIRLAQPVQVQEPICAVKEDDYASRMSKESIRIYADSDVYALLADVEEEFTRMGERQEELPMLGQGVFEGPSRSGTPKAVTPVS